VCVANQVPSVAAGEVVVVLEEKMQFCYTKWQILEMAVYYFPARTEHAVSKEIGPRCLPRYFVTSLEVRAFLLVLRKHELNQSETRWQVRSKEGLQGKTGTGTGR
jgi:hypothetical protein